MKSKTPGKRSNRIAPTRRVPDEDTPEITKDMMERGWVLRSGKMIRGPRKRGRPVDSGKKVEVHIMLDRDIVAEFRLSGKGWQTRLNDLLRSALERGASSLGSHPVKLAGGRKVAQS
jgi:uncharacterized protein (DUF4415 family)